MITVNPDAIRFFKKLPTEQDDIIARYFTPKKTEAKEEEDDDEGVIRLSIPKGTYSSSLHSTSSSESESPSSTSTSPSSTSTPTPTSPSAPTSTELTQSKYTPFSLPHYASPWSFNPAVHTHAFAFGLAPTARVPSPPNTKERESFALSEYYSRDTMYGRESEYFDDESIYSRVSVLDPDQSEEARERFVRRVQAMMKARGEEPEVIPPVPKIPEGLANSAAWNRF
ncbi:hypothetical protein NMY22_g13990 [Coprinellus aureogranulatus]|nr:hypothetical protein NMY22_g13990 [Coprinellus aureogranulatus]